MILITGGLGYLGGRIAKHLIDHHGSEVKVTSRKNISLLPSDISKAEVIKMDLCNKKDIINACKKTDIIIHLAAMNYSESLANPDKANLVNNLATKDLLEAAIKSDVKKFIYFSTAHVYGSNIKGIINESTPTNPNNPYSQTHLEAEKHVLYFHKNKSLNSIILRLSNSIGRPISIDANCWMLAVNHFCREAVLRKEIIINGNPYDQKNFIPISNVERLVAGLISNNLDDYFGQTINIGHRKSLAIIDMAQMISERCKFLLGYTPRIIIKNKNIDVKINAFNYDCRKYRSMNIESSTSLINEIDGILLFCEKQSF